MKSLNPSELKQWIDSGKSFQLIDVREKFEYDIVHIPNALLVPLRKLTSNAADLELRQPAVIYCHHGSRSQIACMILNQKGMNDLYNLNGGINAYALEADPSLKTY